MSSSGEERPSFPKILDISIVCGPRPSWALITAVNACAAIPYPLQVKKTLPSVKNSGKGKKQIS